MSEYICEREDTRLTVKTDGDACEFTLPSWTQKEEIVRCRDCRHYELHPGGIDACNREHEESDWYMIVEPGGFCSWGERKQD